MLQGLSEGQTQELKQKYGDNVLALREGPFWFEILLSQFKSPLIYVLLLIVLISIPLLEFVDAGLALAVLILDVAMGFWQEYSAQRTLAALRRILKPKTMVIRDGVKKEVEVKDLVPGDLVVLGAGDRVPSDGRLIEGVNVLINEAILTGEEEAVEKSLKEESHALYMGTTVLSGRGVMEVEKIGQKTKMGEIGASLAEIKEAPTPIQKRLAIFSRNLAWVILILCALILLFGVLHRENFWEMSRIAVILAIAAIPEALPIAITVILAIGMRRILTQQGLVKKLLSIETLGSTSVICTDKTGTLTQGVMEVLKTDFTDKKKALNALVLNNDQKDSLEIALWNFAVQKNKLNAEKILEAAERIYDEPFDSEKKYSLVVDRINGKDIAYTMGAPEIILSFCEASEADKKAALNKVEEWAGEGLRVVGIACKEKGHPKQKKDYNWLGLIGVKDPVRPGARDSIAIAQKAGIKIKIVTGDYLKTAQRVAHDVGLTIVPENTMDGEELEFISDKNLKERIDEIVLFSRVTPHQKLKIIRVLQEKGEVVAMTGDGVNDAPALKKADIGVVVGSASDVAKEASDLLLLDSDFKTIVAACEEGRLIFANIKKVVAYVLSNSFAEIVLIFGAMLLNFPVPLLIVQILYIHLIIDGPPDILLGFEPKEKGLMAEKPAALRRENVLSKSMLFLTITISLAAGVISLFIFDRYYSNTGDLNLARTVAFAIIASISMVYVFAFKNLKKPIILTENFFQNKYLFWGVLYGFVLIFAAVYIPGLNRVLKTVPLNFSHWLVVFSISIAMTLWVELVKIMTKRKEAK